LSVSCGARLVAHVLEVHLRLVVEDHLALEPNLLHRVGHLELRAEVAVEAVLATPGLHVNDARARPSRLFGQQGELEWLLFLRRPFGRWNEEFPRQRHRLLHRLLLETRLRLGELALLALILALLTPLRLACLALGTLLRVLRV
jgi:hypothetical protein